MHSIKHKFPDWFVLDSKKNHPDMISARIKPQNPSANLKSYYEACRNFSWSKLEDHFTSIRSGSCNIVSQMIDRWVLDEQRAHKPGFIFVADGDDGSFTYFMLKEYSCRLANLLVSHGLEKGDRLVINLAPCSKMYLMMLACARIGVIFSVVDAGLGTDALDHMLLDIKPKAILTDLLTAPIFDTVTYKKFDKVFVVGSENTLVFDNEILIDDLIGQYEPEFPAREFAPDTPLFIVYISGATSAPKGVTHSHRIMLGAFATARYVLDLNQDSVFWSDADPSTMVGIVYGCFAPWLCGATAVTLGIPFSPSACCLALERLGVSVWLTNPLNLEKLKLGGDDLSAGYDFSKLSHIVSLGKNLDPEMFYWVKDKFKVGPHDSWAMTEAGMICLANYPSEQIKLGSMGKPFPGLEARIIDEKGEELPILTLGELAFRANWPSLMLGIWNSDSRTQAYYRDGWFLTGDLALKDEDGYYYHHGRRDDLLRVGCKCVGPYLIEIVMRKHSAVDDVAVILKRGVGDDAFFKAYVKTKNGESPSAELSESLLRFVKSSMNEEIPVQEIEFVKELPRSSNGKVLRRVLSAWDLGLPTGDYSKLSGCATEI